MWTISELKDNAKIALKRFYWVAFAVALVYSIISGKLSGGASFANGFSNSAVRGSNSQVDSYENAMMGQDYQRILDQINESDKLVLFGVVVFVVLAIYLIVGTISTCYNVFVVSPLTIGLNRYYVMARGFDNINFGVLFSSFQKGRYGAGIRLGWAKFWRITLWSLLFIVPGIIKSYQYCMAEYIIAENPGIDAKRALQLSKDMTDGEKWHIFCLQLSFIGWYILGLVLCGLGILFVEPYYYATMAELYTVLRGKAFANGDTNAKELVGFDPSDR